MSYSSFIQSERKACIVLPSQSTTTESALTVLPPDGSDGLVVELGRVGLAVVGYDEDALTFGGGVELDQTERRLPAGDDGQLDAQVAFVGSGV